MKDKEIRIPLRDEEYAELIRYYGDDDYLLGMSFENKTLVIEIHKIQVISMDESKFENRN